MIKTEVDMAQEKGVSEEELRTIKKYIDEIRYGSISIVIQDGKVIQIDKNEKIRIK